MYLPISSNEVLSAMRSGRQSLLQQNRRRQALDSLTCDEPSAEEACDEGLQGVSLGRVVVLVAAAAPAHAQQDADQVLEHRKRSWRMGERYKSHVCYIQWLENADLLT